MAKHLTKQRIFPSEISLEDGLTIALCLKSFTGNHIDLTSDSSPTVMVISQVTSIEPSANTRSVNT